MRALLIGIVTLLLAAGVPLVAQVRHPQQRPLAAYLVFASVFLLSAGVLFVLLASLAQGLGLGSVLEGAAAAGFLLLVFGPAAGIAIWQAGKPPLRRGLPD
jgi:hypothetical protein